MKLPLLTVDAIVNLLLGLPLMLAPRSITSLLGLPLPASGFYPAILGAILTGIGIALLIHILTPDITVTGLGLEGAICINLFGSVVLLFWLLFGGLTIPLRGRIFLWIVTLIVMAISIVEFRWFLKKGKKLSARIDNTGA